MTRHHERKIVPYTPDQMFDLIADIRKYPEFIPWCTGMRIREDASRLGEGRMTADMAVRFKMFREKFTTRVDLNKANNEVHVAYIDGPFRHLHNVWRFEENPDGSCTIDFDIEFEFKNALLQIAIASVFDRAVEKMVSAFVTRAYDLYGASGRATPLTG